MFLINYLANVLCVFSCWSFFLTDYLPWKALFCLNLILKFTVSSMKRWLSAQRKAENGAVEVSFECRTTKRSRFHFLFQIFIYVKLPRGDGRRGKMSLSCLIIPLFISCKKTVIIWGLKEFLIRRNYIPVSIAASTTRNARTSAFPVLGRQWAVQRNWRPLLSYFRPYEQSRHNGNVLLIGRYSLQLLLGMCHRKHSEFSRCELYEAIDCWLGVQLRSYSFVFDCETTAARKVSW